MPRELIDTGRDKRYVRRNKKGQFKESDDVKRLDHEWVAVGVVAALLRQVSRME